MLKTLRIAVTALGLAACVPLVALWVRSYRWTDVITVCTSNFDIGAESVAGGTGVYLYVESGRAIERGFFYERHDQNDWPDMPPPDRTWQFQVETTPYEIFVSLPHWFYLALAGIFSIAPWIRRFSLRTLLIATTLVAVGLGMIVVLR
jgi:hypothetical protein